MEPANWTELAGDGYSVTKLLPSFKQGYFHPLSLDCRKPMQGISWTTLNSLNSLQSKRNK